MAKLDRRTKESILLISVENVVEALRSDDPLGIFVAYPIAEATSTSLGNGNPLRREANYILKQVRMARDHTQSMAFRLNAYDAVQKAWEHINRAYSEFFPENPVEVRF